MPQQLNAYAYSKVKAEEELRTLTKKIDKQKNEFDNLDSVLRQKREKLEQMVARKTELEAFLKTL